MSMIAKAFKPDMEMYASGERTEREFYYDQYCSLLPLFKGATAILEESQETCDDCCDAYDLLKAFREGMSAAEKGVGKTKRNPPKRVSPDEIREIIAEGNLLVCVYSTSREPIKEWFVVLPSKGLEVPKTEEAA